MNSDPEVFEKTTKTIKQTISRKKAENGMLDLSFPAIKPNITKEKAVNKINSLYLRAICPDDHFIQEPLASVIQHEAR